MRTALSVRDARRGFTLIELLVVIAIIAILAAILFPVFAQAKEAAKKTQCLSNMKQMSLAMNLYGNDNDGSYVTWSDYYWDYYNILPVGAKGVDNPTRYWDAHLLPYVKSGTPGGTLNENGVQTAPSDFSGVWKCPDQQDSKKRSVGISQCFAYVCDPTATGNTNYYRILNESQVALPSNLPFAGDGGSDGRMAPSYSFAGYGDFYGLNNPTLNREAPQRHGGGRDGSANYAYIDGHAKSQARSKMFFWPTSGKAVTTADVYTARCQVANVWAATESERSNSAAYVVSKGYPCTLSQ